MAAIAMAIMVIGFGELARGQTLEVLHSFDNTNGANPAAGLVQASEGSFYGTTRVGGANNKGTIFRIKADASFTLLASFDGTAGSFPIGLAKASDDTFYGMTTAGGAAGYGGIFRINTNGNLTNLVSFNGANGSNPTGDLLLTAGGIFYGTTSAGGTSNWGTIFQLTTNGALTTLHSFSLDTNGVQPVGGLAQAADGCLYGMTRGGGGTIFRVTTNGDLTTLVTFDGTNGSYPQTGLMVGQDGLLYGATTGGVPSNAGTLFNITTNGVFTTLAVLSFNGGYQPGLLTQQSYNSFYGAMRAGATSNYGTVFRMLTNGVVTNIVDFASIAEGPRMPQCRLVLGIDGNLYGTSVHGGKYNNGGTDDTSYGTVFRIVLPLALKARVLGQDFIVSWPTNAPDFKLEFAGALSASTTWAELTNTPSVIGSEFVVTNCICNGARLYRLKR